MRWVSWWLVGALVMTGGACGSDDKAGSGGSSTGGTTATGATGGSAGTTSACSPGETRTCVGPGACQGGQTCEQSGTWSTCDCGAGGSGGSGGSGGTAGSPSGGGGTPTGGSGGVAGTDGSAGSGATGGTGGAAGVDAGTDSSASDASDGGDADSGCPAGNKYCGSACVPVGPDTGCGNVSCTACSFQNATATCAANKCAIASCVQGYTDCDGNDANGCEIHTAVDPNHCGLCTTKCSFANATAKCSGGSCAIDTCNTGTADCDKSSTNGCEANLMTETSHCGSCANACGASAQCNGGQCVCPGVTNTSGNPVVQKCYDCLGAYCCSTYAACLADTTCASYLKTTWANCVNNNGLSGCCFGCGNSNPLWVAMRSCVATVFNATPSCSGGCGSTN